MKHVTAVFGVIFVIAIGAVLWPVSGSAQGQSGCRLFQAVAQAMLPSSTPLGLAKDVWGGPLYSTFGDEFLLGLVSGYDGVRETNASIGQKRDGTYTVGFGCSLQPGGTYFCTDTFTYEVPNTVYTQPPGFGQYIGNSAKISGGTGRFQFASGNLNVKGPFIAWPVGAGKLSGRWNPELSGYICGVQ